MELTRTSLVLASASAFRAKILADCGLRFEARAARVDERAIEEPLVRAGAAPEAVAEALAVAKAREVSARFPDACVIGCDQTLGLDGIVLHKPVDMEAAASRLLALSGRTHRLNSGICLVQGGEILWSHVEICAVAFRELEPGFVGRHLAEVGNAALSSVGGYQIEGRGAQLIERIDGDLFSIIGLPLLPLLAQLRRLDLIDH